MADSGKKTDNGKLYYGDKTINYLKRKSRQSVEKYHNSPILFFAVDYQNSKKSFYGQMMVKKFINSTGTELRGVYKIEQDEDQLQNGVPSKTMKLTVSVFFDQLTELDIDPQLGDYFGIGKRLYQIHSRTADDVGSNSLLVQRGKVRKTFLCFEDSDEVLQKNAFGISDDASYHSNPETDLL